MNLQPELNLYLELTACKYLFCAELQRRRQAEQSNGVQDEKADAEYDQHDDDPVKRRVHAAAEERQHDSDDDERKD